MISATAVCLSDDLGRVVGSGSDLEEMHIVQKCNNVELGAWGWGTILC